MAGPYESLLDQAEPSYASSLNQGQPSYAGILSAREQMIHQTANGQPVDPQVIAKADQEATTLLREGMNGLRRFGYSTLATGQAFAGSMIAPFAPETGQGLIDEGLRTIKGMPADIQPTVANWADVHDARTGALKFVSAVGEGLPSSALTVGGILAGRGLGRGLAALGGARGAALETAANRAGWIGGGVTMVPGEGGETALDLAQDPQAMANTTPWQRAGLVGARGLVNAGLEEIVPQALVVPHLLGKAARIAPGFRAGLRNTALLAGEGALGEYGTEFAQDLTGQLAQNIAHPGTGYNLQSAHEAGLSGAATGIFMGGAGGAAQAIHSNIAPVTDKIGEGIDAVKAKLPKAPTFDDIVGGVLGAIKDPEGTGRALAGQTMDGLAKAAEAAGVLKEYGIKGLQTAEEVGSKMYDNTVDFINKKIKDPAIKDEFLQRAAELKTLSLPEWNIFKRDLSTVTGEQFRENLGAAATVGATRAWEGAKNVFKWGSDAVKGFASGLGKAADEEGGKASISAPDANDRKTAMGQVYAAAPGLRDAIEKMAPTLSAKRDMADMLHYAITNPQFLESASHSPEMARALAEWTSRTGTDLNKIVDAVRTHRNDVTFEQIASDNASRAMHQLGINPQHHDDLLDMARAANGADYDALPESQQRLLWQMAGKNELKSRSLYAALESSFDKGQKAAERKVGEAGRIKSQMPGLMGGLETSSVTGARPTSDDAFAGADTGLASTEGTFDENGRRMDVATERQGLSPFDHEVFKRILVQQKYANRPETTMPVTLKATNADIHPKQLAAVFGVRTGKESWEPHAKDKVRWNKAGELEQNINPMSLANIVTDKRFIEQFAQHLVGLDQRPGATQEEIKGQRFINSIGALVDRGLHIDPQVFGLPESHPPVHVQVNAKMSDLHHNLIIDRQRDSKGVMQNLTWGDLVKPLKQRTTLHRQNARLRELQGKYEGSAEKLHESGDPADKKISAAVYRAVASSHPNFSELRSKEKQAALDAGVEAYHKALPERIRTQSAKKRLSARMASIVNSVRESLANEDITMEDAQTLTAYYSGVDDTDGSLAEHAKRISDAVGQPLIHRGEQAETAAKLAQRLDDMMETSAEGREGYEATQQGRGEESTRTGDVNLAYLAHKYSAIQKMQQTRTRGFEKDVRTGRAEAKRHEGTKGEVNPNPDAARQAAAEVDRMRTTKEITRSEVQANPDTIYLFGDNTARRGKGGQAKEMRGEPNAIGIATKKLPSITEGSFFTDDELEANVKQIDEDFAKIPKDKNVIIPPLGEGRAQLAKRAPRTYAYLQWKIQQLIGKKAEDLTPNPSPLPLPAYPHAVSKPELTPAKTVTVVPKDVTGAQLKAAQAKEEMSPGVKTVIDRITDLLETRRKSLLQRAGNNPTLVDRINQFINDTLQKVNDAAGELHEKLKDSSVGELLTKYRPLLLKRLLPLEEAVTKSRSVVRNIDEARGKKTMATTPERYVDITKSAPQDNVTFLNKQLKKPLTHTELNGLVQSWAKKYMPNVAVNLHIYERQAGDPRGFVMQKLGDNTIYIANQHADRIAAISTMAHEFGHMMEYNHFNSASNEVKNSIFAAYNADMKALKDGELTTAEAIQRFGNAANAVLQQKELGNKSRLKAAMEKSGGDIASDADLAYATSFKEWFANQFSKMVTQGLDKNLSPEEKSFWTALSKKAKQFFDEVVKKLTPSAAYEDWVKTLATEPQPASATPPPGPPNKPPGPPGPPEVPPGGGFPHDEAKQRFLDVVHSMMGNKKIEVLFDQKMAKGVPGTFWTRQEMLDKLYRQRNALVEERKAAIKRTDQGSIDDLTEKIEALEAKEQDINMDTAVQGFISLAAGMEKIDGLAEHETFHAAFKIFFDENERRIMGQAFTQGLAGRQLREIFKDDPVVMARISGDNVRAEEAAAYAFQIWAQDPSKFQLGPRVGNMFQRFINFIRKLVGSLTLEEKAEMIMESLKSGRRYEQNISPVQKILDKDSAWKDRAQKMAQDVGGLLKSGYDMLLSPARQRLIDTDNPALTKIAKLAYEATGEEGNEGGMTQRQRKKYKVEYNELGAIFNKLSEAQLQELHQHMVLGSPTPDAVVAERVKQLHQWYRDLFTYQTKAGVQLNNAGIKEDYYPLTWSPEKVLKNKQAFIDMLEKKEYRENMLSLKKTPNELYNSITNYIDRGEDLVNVMGQNNEPLSESSKARTLWFLKKEDRLPFMDDNPVHTAMRYMKQAIRQAEYVRAFGMNGEKLKAMKEEATGTYGATADQMALVNDYIDGTLGNKEVGMPRELKDLYGAMTVYQNYRLLPFNLFSSLVDPLGVAIRSGSATDAWETFTYSVKGLFNEWKKDYPRDFFAKYAEDMGIIEHSGTTISAHNQFDGITLRGVTKELNDNLFKYNLLNGWMRNNTIMAAKAGQRFIYRASEGAFGKHSQRYMDELGLTKADVHYDEQQKRLLLYADELELAGLSKADAQALEAKLGNAVEKFVRQSMLNPNSAELPNWMSNPYMAPIAHLKQFVFAFDATIVHRIMHELEHGNFKPAALAAAYVPGMIAADFMKDMIAGFGEEPPYKKGWGFFDYFNDGVQRSGLMGAGQFFSSATEDVMRGGGGYESFAGPSLQQLQQGAKAFSSGNQTAIKDFMIKSMPLMPLYKQHLINGSGGGGQSGGGGGAGGLVGMSDDIVIAAARAA